MNFFTSKEIKPAGWLAAQLRVQADGLCGNLDRVWGDVRDSMWIGGEREGWERVPYWLDGFIPLAYLLNDEGMIARAKKYIDAIISHQQDDGWLCPCTPEERKTYDTWAVQLISKTLTVYYDCSGDERIPPVLYKMLKNYYSLLAAGEIKLFGWGQYRWFETFVALNLLSERSGDTWIAELAHILDAQGKDYNTISDRFVKPKNEWTLDTHVVNLAMMLRIEPLTDKLLCGKYRGCAKRLYEFIMKYNGTCVDIFTGDECLSGISPIQGTELCAVAELMYSFEHLYAQSGDGYWAERLETAAFNAFFASLSDDMWAHQYVQMANQISCERFPGKAIFRTNGADAHIFGLEPNYGCCTANFGQALPKFALSSFFRDGDTVVSSALVPSSLTTDDLSVSLRTEYPFKRRLIYTAKAKKDFRLKVRVPSFCREITVNGEKAELRDCLIFDIPANEKREISIELFYEPGLIDRPNGMKTLKYGPLVFSLPIEYEKKMHEYTADGVERKFPYCDYEYVGKSEWRYGFAGSKFTVIENNISDIPFSGKAPPVEIAADVAPIEWDFEDGYDTVAAKVPSGRKPKGKSEQKHFIPYGCAKLRMSELPQVE